MKLKNFQAAFVAATLGVIGLETGFAADAETTVVRQTVAIDRSRLSPDLLSLGKLVQSGVDDKVLVTFILNSPPKRNPTAEELVYLHELGLSSEAMVALMNAVPKVSIVETQSAAAPSSDRILEPLLAQRAYQPGGTVQSAPAAVVTQAHAQSSVSGNTVISAPAPSVVYMQPAPPPVVVQQQPVVTYVEQPPVVTYVEPVRPRVSFSFGFGHLFGHHHGGHHWGGHHGGHLGGRWGGHHGGHHGGGHRGRHH